MAFTRELPVWNKTGVAPNQTKQNAGWGVEEKPPADWFNWQWNTTFKALEELQRDSIHRDGSTALTGQLHSNVPNGTAPFAVLSSTVVINLNADMLDGYHASLSSSGNTIVARDVNGDIASRVLISKAASGTAPLTVTSQTVVTNLNADMVDSYHVNEGAAAKTIAGRDASGDITSRRFISNVANGTAPFSVVSSTVVTNLNADTVDGWHMDQDVRKAASPAFAGLSLTAADGIAPFTVTSKTMVPNLNAEMLNGAKASTAGAADTLAQRDASGNLTGNRLVSTVANGSQPILVSSSTMVDNLNAAMLAGWRVYNTYTDLRVEATANMQDIYNAMSSNSIAKLIVDVNNQGMLGLTADDYGVMTIVKYSNTRSEVIFYPNGHNSLLKMGKFNTLGVWQGWAPIAINNGIAQTSLNADMVDGYHLNQDVRNTAAPKFSGLNIENLGNAMIYLNNTTATVGRRYSVYSNNSGLFVIGDENAQLARLTINTSGQVSIPVTNAAPLIVNNSTVVNNLNADLLDGYHANLGGVGNTVMVRGSNGESSATYYLTNAGQSATTLAHFMMRTNNNLRFHLGLYGLETGSNKGSDFALVAVNDAGAYLGNAFTVERATQEVTFPKRVRAVGGLTVEGGMLTVNDMADFMNDTFFHQGANFMQPVRAEDSMTATQYITNNGTSASGNRHVSLRVNERNRFSHNLFGAEGTGATGSNYALTAHDSNGSPMGDAFTVERATQQVSFPQVPIFNKGIATASGTSAGGNIHLAINNGLGSGKTRWGIGLINAESAGNGGSDYVMWRYDNSGAWLSNILSISRSTGVLNFTYSPTVPTPLEASNSNLVANTEYVTRAANNLSSIKIVDTREVNSPPNFYGGRVYTEFKRATAIGLPNGIGTYCTLITDGRYTDSTGGSPTQIACTDGAGIWTRVAISTTAWGAWKRLATTEYVDDALNPNKRTFIRAARTTTQSFPQTTETKVQYNTLRDNHLSEWDSAQFAFVPKSDGVYMVTVSWAFNFTSVSSGYVSILTRINDQDFRNDTRARELFKTPPATGTYNGATSQIVKLTAGEALSVYYSVGPGTFSLSTPYDGNNLIITKIA